MRLFQKVFLMQCLFIINALKKRPTKEQPKEPNGFRIPDVTKVPDPESFEEQEETAEFLKAARIGELAIKKRLKEDKQFLKYKIFAEPGSATSVHQSLLSASSETEELSINAIGMEAATEAFLTSRGCNSGNEDFEYLTSFKKPRFCNNEEIFTKDLTNTAFGRRFCPTPPPMLSCTNNDFRTFDGSCNNLNYPLLGKASTAFLRLLPNAYEDGLKTPRTKSVYGSELPCARKVSQVLGSCTNSKDQDHTMLVMQWGQFIDHDLTKSPTGKVSGYGSVDCCSKSIKKKGHSLCFPICIPSDDPFYGCFNKVCMSFARTMSVPSIFCNFGPRQQVNDLSHYLDGSMLYGSNSATANNLREFVGGRLQVQQDFTSLNILPQNSITDCKPTPGHCFKAGDERVNEQPNLAITHTMWMKEHNRIADYYTSLGDNDNDAYYKARKLVIAEIQHITYNEFLPAVLGTLPWITPSPLGTYFAGYDPTTNPSISNAFATAAFRFGHSLLGDHVEQHWQSFPLPTQFSLSSLFFNQGPVHFWNNRLLFARGMSRQFSEKVDMCFTKEVTQRLFEKIGDPGSGLDLVALNIQRGRDHGLPGYVQYRNVFCQSPNKVYSFNDMTWLSPSVKSLLTGVYADVRDVDLFVGGLLEPLQPGALVGETFQCIIGDQFRRLKEGDRYFYENHQQPFSFTIPQLDAIKQQVSLARIFCDHVDGLKEIQPQVFSSSTTYELCSNQAAIPALDLSLF